MICNFDTRFAKVQAEQFFGDDPSVKAITEMLNAIKFKTYRIQLLQSPGTGRSMLIHDGGIIHTVRPSDMVVVGENGETRVVGQRSFWALYGKGEKD